MCAAISPEAFTCKADAQFKTPKIINASESIVDGSICVENYHAILQNTKSSIRESLKGKGARVAVLNDEAHHVANESGTTSKRWKEFLAHADYGFRMVVGVSGTCYVADEYFADVVHRYSLRQAIEQKFVKSVEYVDELPPAAEKPEEKWQLVYNRHKDWKKKLRSRGIRPLTIVVTKGIADAERVAEEFREFLKEWEGLKADQAAAKVLCVTSAAKHQPNIAKLRVVDSPASKVEWIVSVSMLSEGWDVKNVFQIVPHEERAFNSKLLIAQVLGRGLRRHDDWKGEEPVVTVFNHDSWSNRIKHLVNEILEIERRLTSTVDPASASAIVPQAAGQLRRAKRQSSSTEIFEQPARELNSPIWPPAVAKIPWFHNVILIEKLKNQTQRLWYAQQTIANGWSRSMLLHWIESDLYSRQGNAVTNFQSTLPSPQSDLAQQLLKDPYNFDFLTLATDAHEREAESGLTSHIRQFLLELGVGFAFVGQQYPIEVAGEEFLIDLLFYHCRLHCYFVIDLKMRAFEPEHAGKMSFYLSAVDDLLRDPAVDQPTLGLILCRDKNRLIAEYALRDIHKPIGVAGWETKLVETLPKNLRGNLPTIEELEAELSREPAPMQPPKRRRRTDA